MVLGVLQVSFQIPDAFSLKDKRRVLNSIKQRVRNTFNAAVAETGVLDRCEEGMMGIACVSNEKRHAQEMLSKIASFIEKEKRIVVIDMQTEVLN
jgi:uncharacterized protein